MQFIERPAGLELGPGQGLGHFQVPISEKDRELFDKYEEKFIKCVK